MSAFIYLIGSVLVIAGAAYGAFLLGVPQIWIVVGAVIVGGLAVMAAATYVRRTAIVPTAGAPIVTGSL